MSNHIKGDPTLVLDAAGNVRFKVATGVEIANIQRSARDERWERVQKNFQALLADPAKRKTLDDSFLEVRGVPAGQVHADQFLSQFSQAYANDAYIGEQLITSVPVDKRTDKYAIFPQREMFEAPDDLLTSERARANEISATRTSATYELKDYALENFISNEALENQDVPFDERAAAVAELAEHLLRKRELRDATLLTTSSSYGSGNTTTLSGSSQWNSASGGDPIKVIQDAKAALFNGPGASQLVAFTSLDVFNAMARNPILLDLQKYTTNGLLTPQALANYFGFAKLLIGEARHQTANEGQTASYSRIWGNHFGIIRVASTPTKRSAGFAARFRKRTDPIVTEWFDGRAGKSGGYYMKNAVSEDAKIVASFAGYLVVNAIS